MQSKQLTVMDTVFNVPVVYLRYTFYFNGLFRRVI